MLFIGATLTLELTRSDEEEKETYRCKLVELRGDKMYIDYPVNEKTGKTSIFFEGTRFKVSFVGKDDSVYVFHTELLGRIKLRNIPALILYYPGKDHLMKIQRREYVRIKANLDVALHDLKNERPPMITRTLDISGGGIATLAPKRLAYKPDEELDTWIVLPFKQSEYAYIHARTMLIRHIKGNSESPDKLTFKFSEIYERDRQKIIQYCFEKQLEARRKGLSIRE
ncbi:MAG: flagellar brake domain-containing protein [Bacillaceae bacterium]|nr:flagellar brake domain-containing protein [Bacillaceae bacterium]